MEPDEYDILHKVILVGESGAGKTHMLSRYLRGSLPEIPTATIGVENATRHVTLEGGGVAKMQIWDTGGSVRYRSIASFHFRCSVGCLLVYDVTRKETFDACRNWISTVREAAEPNVVMMLVGNKIDLVGAHPSARQVSKDDVDKLASELDLFTAECSVLKGYESTITNLFESLAQEIIYHSQGIFNEYKTIVLTLTKDENEVEQGTVSLLVTNIAGEQMLSFRLDQKEDSLDVFWETLCSGLGKLQHQIQLVKLDGTLLPDDASLADFLGCPLKAVDLAGASGSCEENPEGTS